MTYDVEIATTASYLSDDEARVQIWEVGEDQHRQLVTDTLCSPRDIGWVIQEVVG